MADEIINTPVTVDIVCACGRKLGEQTLRETPHPRAQTSKVLCGRCADKHFEAIAAKKAKVK